jgi:hypothetical protein
LIDGTNCSAKKRKHANQLEVGFTGGLLLYCLNCFNGYGGTIGRGEERGGEEKQKNGYERRV